MNFNSDKNQNKTTSQIFWGWDYGLDFVKNLSIPCLISVTEGGCIIHFPNPAPLYQDWKTPPKAAALLPWLERRCNLGAKLEALTGEELLSWFSCCFAMTGHRLSSFAFQVFFACFPAHHNVIMFLFLAARGRYFLLLRQQLHCTTLMNPHKGKMCLWCLFLPWQPRCSSSFL